MKELTPPKTLPTVSFARMVQQPQSPTIDQAIVLDSMDGHTIQDYAYAIGSLVEPRDILYLSRISNGRICCYLSNKELADKLTVNKTKVNIGSHTLEIRPLVSKAKRIIISNVCPIIPPTIIEDELAKLNIKPCSKITNIRVGLNDPNYAHILSFRRQVYLSPDDVDNKMPASMQILYNNTTYWIYLSTEKLTCFLCKEEGHLAKYCKNADIPHDNAQEASSPANPAEVAPQSNSVQTPLPSKDNESRQEFLTPLNIKRPRSETTSTSGTSINDPPDTQNSVRVAKSCPRRKKTKALEEYTLSKVLEQIQPATDHIRENASTYPLNFDDITNFLLDTHSNVSHSYEIATTKFTTDIPALINMLSEIYSLLTERSLKSRITKIKKYLNRHNMEGCLSDNLSTTDDQETET